MKTAGKNIDINLQAMGKMSEICDVLERSGIRGGIWRPIWFACCSAFSQMTREFSARDSYMIIYYIRITAMVS